MNPPKYKIGDHIRRTDITENKKHDNLFIFNVQEPVIRDVLIEQWLEWWDAAGGVE